MPSKRYIPENCKGCLHLVVAPKRIYCAFPVPDFGMVPPWLGNILKDAEIEIESIMDAEWKSRKCPVRVGD